MRQYALHQLRRQAGPRCLHLCWLAPPAGLPPAPWRHGLRMGGETWCVPSAGNAVCRAGKGRHSCAPTGRAVPLPLAMAGPAAARPLAIGAPHRGDAQHPESTAMAWGGSEWQRGFPSLGWLQCEPLLAQSSCTDRKSTAVLLEELAMMQAADVQGQRQRRRQQAAAPAASKCAAPSAQSSCFNVHRVKLLIHRQEAICRRSTEKGCTESRKPMRVAGGMARARCALCMQRAHNRQVVLGKTESALQQK